MPMPPRLLSVFAAVMALSPMALQAQGVYRCPGPPVLYTDQITPQQAKERNCRSVEGAPVSVVAPIRPRSPAPVLSPSTAPSGGSPENRVARDEQRARDSDARRILEAELRQQEEQLAQMVKEYNNGEPERRGDERNFERYRDRIAQMKAAIDRKQSDIAAIRRELSKLGGSLGAISAPAPSPAPTPAPAPASTAKS
jgi:hypothetical protein